VSAPGSTESLQWLFDRSGPIIRWRLVRDFGLTSDESDAALLEQVLGTDEVRRWLHNLGGERIHGSKDTDAENPMA
jgi:hypothetical protein